MNMGLESKSTEFTTVARSKQRVAFGAVVHNKRLPGRERKQGVGVNLGGAIADRQDEAFHHHGGVRSGALHGANLLAQDAQVSNTGGAPESHRLITYTETKEVVRWWGWEVGIAATGKRGTILSSN